METITLNYKSVGRSRRETLGGREYLVAPLSMLVPGVLNGSRGPLFYPPELVNKNPAVWNHMPIVVYHPMENGKPTSARDPYILNKQGIGFVFRTKENGRAEGWFDVENTKRVDPRVYDALVKNQPMELSTGLFTKNKAANPNSAYRGKKYVEIVMDFTPDHLAILPDQKGACSMKDGCGMLVNKDSEEEQDETLLAYNRDWPESKRDKLASKDFAGPHQSFPITTQADVDAAAKLIGHADNPDAVKARIIAIAKRKGLTVPESWQTNNSDVVGNFNPLHPLQPRKKGKFIGKPEAKANDGAGNDSHETVKNMQEPGDTTKLANKLAQLVKNKSSNKDDHSGSSKTLVKGEPNMAKKRQVNNEEPVELTEDDRAELIDNLVGNCHCQEDERETLNSLSDETLARIAVNAMPPQLQKGKKKPMMSKADAEDMMDGGEDEDQEDENGKVVKNQANKQQLVANQGAKKVPAKKEVTVNTSKEETPKLDAKTQFLVNYAERKMQEEKDALIEKLTANASEDDVDELTEVYNEMEVEKLELLVKALPKEEKQPVQNQRAERSERGRSNLREGVENLRNGRSFVGAGGAISRQQAKQVNNSRKQADDEDPLAGPLESPTINYAEVAGFKNGTFVHRDKYAEASAN